MRLSGNERNSIVRVIHSVDPLARVFLFGSRVHDSMRGGDIDLLVESRVIDFSKKLSILAEIKACIGEQKIDLVVSTDVLNDPDPFVSAIRLEAVLL